MVQRHRNLFFGRLWQMRLGWDHNGPQNRVGNSGKGGPAVYPEARVEVGDKGLILHPSRPPVAKEKIAAR